MHCVHATAVGVKHIPTTTTSVSIYVYVCTSKAGTKKNYVHATAVGEAYPQQQQQQQRQYLYFCTFVLVEKKKTEHLLVKDITRRDPILPTPAASVFVLLH
jgi:hypothetical protein